jgi:hypothetical protein
LAQPELWLGSHCRYHRYRYRCRCRYCAHHALQDISVCTTTLVAPVRLIIIF